VKLIYKVNLAVIGLLAVSAALVGVFFVVSFRDLRAETYRWFDASAKQLASSIGSQAQESIAYFNYKEMEESLIIFVRVYFSLKPPSPIVTKKYRD
jgi:hypothetical protein